jgi:hypothetical protein
MAKLTLTDITAGYALTTTINANNALVEAALENTLSRDGTAPNAMGAALDMNSNKIQNLTDGVNNQDGVTVYQLTQAQLGVSPLANNVSVTDTDNHYTGTTVEDILDEIWDVFLRLSGGTMTGAIVTPELTDYSITSTSPSISSGAITYDIENGNAFQTTLSENITSITISNPSPTGKYCEIIIKFVQDGTGSRTVAGWPAAVKWSGGSAPTITTTATTGTDIVALKTWDAGTTWYGDFSQDYS